MEIQHPNTSVALYPVELILKREKRKKEGRKGGNEGKRIALTGLEPGTNSVTDVYTNRQRKKMSRKKKDKLSQVIILEPVWESLSVLSFLFLLRMR